MDNHRNIEDIRSAYSNFYKFDKPYSLFLKDVNKNNNAKINLIDDKIIELKKELKAYEERVKKQILKEKLQKEKLINDIKIIHQEYDYKKEIKKLSKRHKFLDVNFDDTNMMSVVWVYLDDQYAKGTDYEDDNFCDNFEDGYKRCVEIIEYMQMTYGIS